MSSSLPQEESLEETARTLPPRGPLARTFSALRYRDFRLLWFGAFTSTTGTWMQTVAQGWLVLQMTDSAFLLGVDGFLATGPMLLFSLFGGVIADRVSRKKIMIFSQYLQMTFAFILAALMYTLFGRVLLGFRRRGRRGWRGRRQGRGARLCGAG